MASMAGVDCGCAPMAAWKRQVVPGHALGGVGVTGGVWAARCAYDFVKPRSRRDAGDGVFASGRRHEIVRGILFRGLVCLIFFLTLAGKGAAARRWLRENVGRGG